MNPSSEPDRTVSRYESLLVALVRAGVDFAVAGGLAVILHGYARVTQDADILVECSDANLAKLLDCLSGWGEGWARELGIEDFAPAEGSIRVSEEFDLDIFTQLKGMTLEDCRARLRRVDLHGCQVSVLGPEDLIRCKEGSWREKDQMDVAAMQELLGRKGPTPRST